MRLPWLFGRGCSPEDAIASPARPCIKRSQHRIATDWVHALDGVEP